MTVAIYIRVSTREQALEGYSIPAQKERLTAYCQAQGWDDYRFYIDPGVSAKDMDRPQLQLLLQHVRERKISMILVFRLDRFTRSVRDLYEMLDLLDKHDCAFKSATEMYDTSNAMGRMFIGLVALLAQWERENIGERVIVALDERASDLKAIGKPPYGYQIKDDYYVMTDDSNEQANIRSIIQSALDGEPVNGIARALNAKKVPTPRGGQVWYASTVKRILNNPALYGAYYYKGVLEEDAFEGYIDKATFNIIQEKLESRATEFIRGTTSDAIFQGVLICPECGHKLSPAVYYSKVSKEKLNYTYKCRKCRDIRDYHKSYNEQKMLDAFMKYMKGLTFHPDPPKKKLPKGNNTEKLKEQIERIENQRLKYQRAWADELMSDDEFTKLMKESRLSLDDLKKELQSLGHEEREVDPTVLKDFLWTFNETFSKLSPIDKRAFVTRFIKEIKFRVISEIVPNRKRPRDSFVITNISYYLG